MPDTPLEPLPETKLLRLFDVLYAQGSVTATAQQLGLSQPTISIWLAQLREQLGDPLFVRTPKGMQPTPRAEALISIVRTALDALRQISGVAPEFDPAQSDRHFCIAMSDASHVNLLPQILGHLRQTAASCSLKAGLIDPTLPERLQSGSADLALGLIPELGAGFYQQTLFTQDWVCLTCADHPRIRARLSLADYRREGHVQIVSGTGHSLLEHALRRARIRRTVVLELPGFLGLSAVLEAGDLIVTVPRQTGETLAGRNALRLHPCPFPIAPFSVKQHWHTRFHHDPGNRWLRQACMTLFGHSPAPRRRSSPV
ncbi:MAG: LysR family transcriptional regulator [Castellaniella sp.]